MTKSSFHRTAGFPKVEIFTSIAFLFWRQREGGGEMCPRGAVLIVPWQINSLQFEISYKQTMGTEQLNAGVQIWPKWRSRGRFSTSAKLLMTRTEDSEDVWIALAEPGSTCTLRLAAKSPEINTMYGRILHTLYIYISERSGDVKAARRLAHFSQLLLCSRDTESERHSLIHSRRLLKSELSKRL